MSRKILHKDNLYSRFVFYFCFFVNIYINYLKDTYYTIYFLLAIFSV